MTEAATAEQLCSMTCQPCEGGVDPMTPDEAAAQVAELAGWTVVADGERIEKTWTLDNFVACVEATKIVCDVAETNGHHPDVHIESYRQLRIQLYTHAIGGLSESDFVVAAKIDAALALDS